MHNESFSSKLYSHIPILKKRKHATGNSYEIWTHHIFVSDRNHWSILPSIYKVLRHYFLSFIAKVHVNMRDSPKIWRANFKINDLFLSRMFFFCHSRILPYIYIIKKLCLIVYQTEPNDQNIDRRIWIFQENSIFQRFSSIWKMSVAITMLGWSTL